MNTIFPNGLFHWDLAPNALLEVLITLVLTGFAIYLYSKGFFRDSFGKALFYLVIVWNAISIYSQLFSIVIPLSYEIMSYIYYALLAAVAGYYFYSRRNLTKKVHNSRTK